MATDAQMVTYIKALLEARVTGETVESYSVHGRSLQNIPSKELMEMLTYYEARVARASADGGIVLADFSAADTR